MTSNVAPSEIPPRITHGERHVLEVESSSPRQGIDLSLVALAVILFLSAFPALFFGGNTPLAFGLALSGVFLLTAVYCLLSLIGRVRFRAQQLSRPSFFFMSFSALFLIVASVQIVPLPIELLELIAPLNARHFASNGLLYGTISLYPQLTAGSVLYFCGLVLVFCWLACLPRKVPRLQQSRSAIRKRRYEREQIVDITHKTLVLVGVLFAAVAVFHLTFGLDAYWGMFSRPGNPQRARWPFVNPNHLAVALEIAFTLALSRFFYRRQVKGSRRRTSRRGSGSSSLNSQVSNLLIILFLGLAVTLTASKAAIGLCFCSLVGLWVFHHRSSPRDKGLTSNLQAHRLLRGFIFVSGTIALLLFFLFLLGDSGRNTLTSRIEYGIAYGDHVRAELLSSTLAMILDTPLTGVGLSCWHLVINSYIDASMAGWTLDYAHNDIAQLIAETGILGFSPVVFIGIHFVLATRKAMQEANHPAPRLLIFGSALALVLPVIHSLVDFPFHIPAIAFLFTVTLGAHYRLLSSAEVSSPELSSEISAPLFRH